MCFEERPSHHATCSVRRDAAIRDPLTEDTATLFAAICDSIVTDLSYAAARGSSTI